jgi:hypothetical protein
MTQPTQDPWGNNQQPPTPPQPAPQPYVFPQPGYGPQPQPPVYPQQPGYPQQPQQQPGLWNPSGDYGGVPEPKKNRVPWWGWLIIVVAALIVISGVLTANTKSQIAATITQAAAVVPTAAPLDNSSANVSNATATAYAAKVYANLTAGASGAIPQSNSGQSPIPTVRSIPTPTSIPQSVKGRIGQTLSQNGYIITVNQAEKSQSYGDYKKAKPGNIFLAVDITIQSDKDKGVSVSTFEATLKDGQGFKYDATFLGKDPQLATQNDLPKGEKIRGWVTFEVPQTARGFTLEYKPILEFTTSTLITFILE